MRIGILTIVGVGLIGGSLGLAARQRGLAVHVIGAGRRRESLEQARQLGAVDEISLDLDQAVRRAEVAVFCTPVDQIARQVLSAAPGCSSGTLLTDTGSTKAALLHAVESGLPPGVAFVGSHPLAGSEKRGPEHAQAHLFQGRLTIVTRTARTDPAALERIVSFWQALGSRVQILDPQEHDRALALTSHLPHLVASALAGLLPPELRELAATGFRDTTRVASGDPSLWTGIFKQNRASVLEVLDRLGEHLAGFRAALEADDSALINDWLAQGKRGRDALGI
jgi:prephenate dehydrogenase